MKQPIQPHVANDWAKSFFGPLFIEIFAQLGKFRNTEVDAKDLHSILRLKPGASILDIPCGFGRFSRYFAVNGYKVTAVDTSLELLQYAQNENAGPIYSYGDMRHPPQGPFDAILNLWTSFGYFSKKEDDEDAVRAWYRVLKPNGILIMEITDLERAASENRSQNERISYNTKTINNIVSEAWIDWDQQLATISYALAGC